jgi:thiosulfate/3-mercaptopyruvate sulfurtransferase
MLPSEDEFASAVWALGISNDTTVVIYDTPSLMTAGRAWWMFRSFRHRRVDILDGGLKSWTADGRATTSELTAPTATSYRAALVLAPIAPSA